LINKKARLVGSRWRHDHHISIATLLLLSSTACSPRKDTSTDLRMMEWVSVAACSDRERAVSIYIIMQSEADQNVSSVN
jgi:hypothetical protein